MTDLYRGVFINLDRSPERRRQIEAQLERLGIADQYQRFSAIDGAMMSGVPPGIIAAEAACFRSHLNALQIAAASGLPVHVLEDDARLAPQFPEIAKLLCETEQPFDIVFTDTHIDPHAAKCRDLKQMFDQHTRSSPPTFTVLDLATLYMGSATSYFVASHAVSKVCEALQRGLDRSPTPPIDLFIRDEMRAGRLHLGCIFPFISTPLEPAALKPSTVVDGRTSIARDLVRLISYSFYVDRNLDSIPLSLTERLRKHDEDAHAKLIGDVLRFVASSPDYA